jgi:hypothetical protein
MLPLAWWWGIATNGNILTFFVDKPTEYSSTASGLRGSVGYIPPGMHLFGLC